MAVEKAKVMTALETRFKGKNLTKTYKDNLATKWAPKIDTDDDIDAFVEAREDGVLESLAEIDRERQKAAATARKEAAKAASGETEPKEDEPAAPALPDGTPDWAKAFFGPLATQMGVLAQTVNGLQQARTTETLTDRFKKDERIKSLLEKGVPEAALKGRIPTKEEDFDAMADEFNADYKTFAETNKITPVGAGLGKDNPPGGGRQISGGGGETDKSAEIKAWAAKNAPKSTS